MCGGNGGSQRVMESGKGLSPLVRGKPRDRVAGDDRHGSIPACAGETIRLMPRRRMSRVYPRLCGGNMDRLTEA